MKRKEIEVTPRFYIQKRPFEHKINKEKEDLSVYSDFSIKKSKRLELLTNKTFKELKEQYKLINDDDLDLLLFQISNPLKSKKCFDSESEVNMINANVFMQSMKFLMHCKEKIELNINSDSLAWSVINFYEKTEKMDKNLLMYLKNFNICYKACEYIALKGVYDNISNAVCTLLIAFGLVYKIIDSQNLGILHNKYDVVYLQGPYKTNKEVNLPNELLQPYYAYSFIFQQNDKIITIVYNEKEKAYERYGATRKLYQIKDIVPLIGRTHCIGTILLNEKIFNRKDEETIIKSDPFDDDVDVTIYDSVENKKYEPEKMKRRELMFTHSFQIFDASDITKFPMFPLSVNEIAKKNKFFVLKLTTPEFGNPSAKMNVKPFAAYREFRNGEERIFIPYINQCKSKNETNVNMVSNSKSDDYRLCTVHNRSITECYHITNDIPYLNFGSGTFVDMYVEKLSTKENSKVVWVNYRINKEFVNVPQLIKADASTFGSSKGDKLSEKEMEWLKKKNIFTNLRNVTRIFGIKTGEGTQFSRTNPFTVPELNMHPDFIVIYNEEVK